ncbi:MBL fold metallo-hydrolase [Spirochaetia bacterium]|nr:MBL fold metallo-hydrolase [Spirochaetia bacterium]
MPGPVKKTTIIAVVLGSAFIFLMSFSTCTSFGRLPRGERLERIKQSDHYRDGQFQNISPPIQETPKKPGMVNFFKVLFSKSKNVRPKNSLPAIKTDLSSLDRTQDILLWLGHSSVFIQIDGVRFLIDPVLVMGAPAAFINRPFKGTALYKPEDIPDIDYLVISHDHWDHLDYNTVKKLKERTGKIICGLGVGEHFEYWGFDKDRIVELEWMEKAPLENGFTIQCFPARHFSGRGLRRNRTLWVSYVLHTPTMNIFISGDGGYDTHFAEIGGQTEIDLAIIENGQYNEAWKNSHLMPDDLIQAVKDIGAQRLFTVHNSKFTLSNHSWDEPLINISRAAEQNNFNLISPMIGEPVFLKDKTQVFNKWWERP